VNTVSAINNIENIDIHDGSILIVDDEASNVLLLEKLLSNEGYSNITSTQYPLEVLQLFKKQNFDLILLDIDMPVLDGYGVLEQLNEYTDNNLPAILVLTAQNLQEFRQRALDCGARDYVTKPFNIRELVSRVYNLLEVQIAHKFLNNQNQILEARVRKRTQEIVETRLQIVRHLGRAAEYRDNETGLHIIRMSKMAVVIAEGAGLDEEQCEMLLNAAPMHDIGKIGIPDRILLKPGKLDADEWEIMKTHAAIGEKVLSNDTSALMVMAKTIAGSHHEKWNGEGYPRGLSGEDIPLVGRITAIADVFDALTSVRTYKKEWSIDKAKELIISESGKQFDPRLVEVFIEKLSEIIKIKVEHAEPTIGSEVQ